jgi:hypothetical protein
LRRTIKTKVRFSVAVVIVIWLLPNKCFSWWMYVVSMMIVPKTHVLFTRTCEYLTYMLRILK